MSRLVLFSALLLGPVVSLPVAAQTAPNPQQEIATHTRLAQEYLQHNRPDLAVPQLEKLAALEPNDPDVRGNLGVLLFFQGKYAEATPQLSAALQLQPNLPKIRALLGMSQKRTGDLKDAAENLQNAFPAVQEKPIQVQAGLELIETDVALGHLDRAAVVAGQLREIEPENPRILSTAFQIYSQLRDEALLSLMLAAPDSAEMHMLMAHQMVERGDNAGALAQYQAALKINPSLPGLHYEYAEMLHDSSQPALQAQAEGQYQDALKVNAFDAKAIRALGDIAAAKGDAKQAEDDYNRALALEPNDAEARTGLAKVLITEGEKPKALAMLESAVQIDPTNAVAHYRLSTLYRQMGRPEDAKKQLAEYQHYTQLKDKLGKVFQQIKTNPDESVARGTVAPK